MSEISDKAKEILRDEHYRILGGSTRVSEDPGDRLWCALDAAGLTIVRASQDLLQALDVVRVQRETAYTGDLVTEPRWAEADDVPLNQPFELGALVVLPEPATVQEIAEFPEDWGDPPEHEPKPGCTRPSKRKFGSEYAAKLGADQIKRSVGPNYDPLYPYQCPAGGHWHLSHYRQGTAKCPVCQLPKPAWRGGDAYWVIAKHMSVGNAGPCNGTGARVEAK